MYTQNIHAFTNTYIHREVEDIIIHEHTRELYIY